jgi:hypothetical protein
MSIGIQTDSDHLEVDNCELSGWSHVAVFLAAGKGHRIHHNTFLESGVRAVVIRGVPREEARIDHNWFAHERAGENLIGPWPLTAESRIFLENSAYGRRHPKVLDPKAE